MCFLSCGSQSKTYSRAKAEPWSKQKTMGEGARGEGHCLRAQYIIYYSHESANTHNVNTGDKSVWYIILYTENIFSVYFTNQTNWIMIYTWPYYLLVCKLFIFFFSYLRTIHFRFFAFANIFFPDCSSPSQKIMVGFLKQHISQNENLPRPKKRQLRWLEWCSWKNHFAETTTQKQIVCVPKNFITPSKK